MMISMTQPEAVSEGSLAGVVADRLRGRLAEKRIRQTEVMLATGWSKATAYRKMNGKSDLDVGDFEKLWRAFGISPVFLITGRPDGNSPWPGPNGSQSHPGESNPRPIHYE